MTATVDARRPGTRRAGLVVFVTVALIGLAWSLPTLTGAAGATVRYPYWRESTVNGTAFALVGAVVLAYHPRHLVGWLLGGIGLISALQIVTGQYALLRPSPRGAAAAGLASVLIQSSVVLALILTVLLYPTGRLLSSRWRAVAASLVVGLALWLVVTALTPGPVEVQDFPGIGNPIGVGGIAPVLAGAGILANLLLGMGMLGAFASLRSAIATVQPASVSLWVRAPDGAEVQP